MRQVEPFLAKIDRSQMLFLLMEDLKIDPKDTLYKIFNFLNVTFEFTPPNITEAFHRAQVPINMNLVHRIKKNKPPIEKKAIRFLIPWEKTSS